MKKNKKKMEDIRRREASVKKSSGATSTMALVINTKTELDPMKISAFFLLFFITLIMFYGVSSYSATNYTFGIFYDTENSLDNTFLAGEIDFVLESTSFVATTTAISLSPNDFVEKIITVIPQDSNPFKYVASTTNATGDIGFCNALSVNADLEGADIYDGSLVDMQTGTTTVLDTWNFSIGMGANNFQNSICNFNTEYFGSQTRHNYPLGSGYNDTEVIENTISSWGFRLNKIYYDVDREIIVKPEINKCEARSQGYWGNHEGCSLGTGSSDWDTEINALSGGFSSVFGSSTGGEICEALHIPLCPSGGTTEGKLCRAKNKLLADELNVVTGKLDINAIISLADDGDSAFDTLGLTSLSRISEALTAVEIVLANASSTDSEITDAGYVAERIYTFYEDENLQAPMCLYDEEYLSSIVFKEVEGENEWVEIYNQTNVPIDINGWEICDNTSCDVLSASSTIPAKGYGLITASSTTASNDLPTFWYLPSEVVAITIPDSRIGNGLSNNDDMLILKRPDGVIIDQMNYGDADMGWVNYNDDVWNPGAPDVTEGNVLARVPSGFDTNQPSDWTELTPPSVDLIYPDEVGSYSWYWNQLYTILWNAINHNGADNELAIDLFYVKDLNQDSLINDGDDMITIVEDTENDGEYDWTVPSGFTGYIWIYLVATGPENPMLNTAQVSGEIWDPIPLFVDTPIVEEPSLVTIALGGGITEEIIVSEEPVVEEPAVTEEAPTEESVVEEPVTEPIVEELVVEDPTPEPVVEEPVVDPAPEEPIVEESIPEETPVEPIAEEPVVEEEPVAEPVVEEPTTEEVPTEEPPLELTDQIDPTSNGADSTEVPVVDPTVEEPVIVEEPAIEPVVESEPVVEEPIVEDPAPEPIVEEPVVEPVAEPIIAE